MPEETALNPNPSVPPSARDPGIPRLEKPVIGQLDWGAARVKVLVLTDGATYSEDDSFGLGIMLADAFDRTHPDHPDYVKFEFTRAHRSTATGVSPGFENFTFTEGSLADYDELWLFGVITTAPYLSTNEVKVVEKFMDAGGGVLAMGDHEDLGLGLSGGIKRVRSMRKWWFEEPPPPPGMLRAPDRVDLTRNDTVHAPMVGGDPNAGTQADATPQQIFPNYRYRWFPWERRWPSTLRLARHPHPVLSGPRGVIQVMPDHAHEGDCILPDPMFAREFPGGEAVEIVAHGRNVVGRIKDGYRISDPREFGLIGAWNGQVPAADKGRVLVDSTWHHWFNINLFGIRTAGMVEYDDILAYFRNCAIWLAPKGQQERMRRAGMLVALQIPSLVEDAMTWKKVEPSGFHTIGAQAKDALGRMAPECQVAAWFYEIVHPHLDDGFEQMFEIDVAEQAEANLDLEWRMVAEAIDFTTTTIFGGAVNSIAARLAEKGGKDFASLHEEIDALVDAGAKAGAEYAKSEFERVRERLAKLG